MLAFWGLLTPLEVDYIPYSLYLRHFFCFHSFFSPFKLAEINPGMRNIKTFNASNELIIYRPTFSISQYL